MIVAVYWSTVPLTLTMEWKTNIKIIEIGRINKFWKLKEGYLI